MTDTHDREIHESSDRVEAARFERESPGERDRGVVAGGGEADLAADRGFEREEMARGADGETALDRDRARDDLARDDATRGDAIARDDATGRNDVSRDEATGRDDIADRDDRDRDDTAGDDDIAARDRTDTDASRDEHGRGRAIAVGGAAAGAAAAHDHDREGERDEIAREDRVRDHDEIAGDRTAVHDRGVATDRTVDRDLDRDGVDDRVERHEPVLAPAALDTMRARQRDRFGGIQWGSDFFGWLSAIGLASLLTAALVGAGVALGLSTDDAANADTAQEIGLGGGIALLAVLAIAWFCGGYVAGRMARFDGARQGIGVWLWTLLAALVVAAAAAIGGTEYDIYARLNLPRIAVGDSTLNAGGAIAGAAAVVVTLLFAIIGGKVGERFHRRVDRVATDEYVVER